MQITFVMLIFPLIMNACQYYIIDGYIKDSSGGDYEAAPGEVEEEEHEGLIRGGSHSDDDEHDNVRVHGEERTRQLSPAARTKEANPIPVPIEYDDMNDGESSSLNRGSAESDKKK